MNRYDIRNMTIEELKALFAEMGEKSFRAEQVFRWIASGVRDFSEMTNISKNLIHRMEETGMYISNLFVEKVQESETDGTKKFLFRLDSTLCDSEHCEFTAGDNEGIGAEPQERELHTGADENSGEKKEKSLFIESVFMKYKYGNSICISSQAGCRMGCRFCASTLGGLKKNLTAGEMADQVISAQRYTGERIGHIVVMGMGEPFDNYDNLSRFIRMVNSEKGLNIGLRNITVSTCGIIPNIEKFAEDFPQVNLAISLHASNSEDRSRIMPINRKYPMEELIRAGRKYAEKTGRRVTYEYTLVSGVNDSVKNAKALSGILRGSLCHVNLIPLNEVSETELKGTDRKDAEKFCEYLVKHGVPATLRRRLGSDIDAACGQLRLRNK